MAKRAVLTYDQEKVDRHMKVCTSCRVCKSPVESVFSLGSQSISNFFSPGQPQGPEAPLELILCSNCGLLQLKHTISAQAMYKNYWYRSGTNKTMRIALADIANTAERLIGLQRGETVLDIGCNDGTLLASYKTPGIYRIGFDPAENLVVHARTVSDCIVNDLFTAEAYQRVAGLQSRQPRIVTSVAMFYDLEDPNTFVSDIRKIMDPSGLWIVQMSFLPLMLKQRDFGNICHEHLEYYSLQSFEFLLHRHDFELADVELNDVNGGSFRAYIRNRPAGSDKFGDAEYRNQAARRIQSFRDKEAEMGLDKPQTYKEFDAWIQRIKDDVSGFVRDQVRSGKTVYVYGASTKGNTMLQFFELDASMISAAADRNPDKWGKVTAGSRIPIISEDEARSAKPDYFLILPWHFLEEFQEREKEYLLGGGRFIVPLPHFALI